MCYSASVSFITFVIGILISYQLYLRNNGNDRWIALFIVSFILIQLLEGIMWVYKDKGLTVPKIMSYLVLITLICQPLAQIYGLLSSGNKLTDNMRLFFKLGFCLLVILGLIVSLNIIPKNILVGKCGHLDWNLTFKNKNYWNIFSVIYLLFLIFPLFFIEPKWRGIILALYLILSAFWIAYVYGAKEFSSMWCFVAIIFGLIAFCT